MVLTFVAALLAASPPVAGLLPGTYTNEQQVVAGVAAVWTGARITSDGAGFTFQPIDAFGANTSAPQRWRVAQTDSLVTIRSGRCRRDFARVAQGLTIINQSRACAGTSGPTAFTDRGMTMADSGGAPIEMQRVRAFAGAATIPRLDGTIWPAAGLVIHDGGGRTLATTDEPVPQSFVIRLWHYGVPLRVDKPGLMLAIYARGRSEPLATGITDAAETRIELKLPSVQAGCALAG